MPTIMDQRTEPGSEPTSEPTSERDEKKNGLQEEHSLSFSEAAAFLRELADVLERGGDIKMAISQQQIQIIPDEPVTLEISYREDPKKKKMEVELEIKEHFGKAASGAGRPRLE